jgi:transposase
LSPWRDDFQEQAMRERIIRRYSASFKQQVIADLESGRFGGIEQARIHYGIGGAMTIRNWLRRYGRNHLQVKVVRVEKPDEADQIRELKRQVTQLQQALGQTQAENVLHAAYLKLACEQLGQEVEAFKKKSDGKPSTRPTKNSK